MLALTDVGERFCAYGLGICNERIWLGTRGRLPHDTDEIQSGRRGLCPETAPVPVPSPCRHTAMSVCVDFSTFFFFFCFPSLRDKNRKLEGAGKETGSH